MQDLTYPPSLFFHWTQHDPALPGCPLDCQARPPALSSSLSSGGGR